MSSVLASELEPLEEDIPANSTALETLQIDYLLHNVLLPSLLSPLFSQDCSSIIIYFALSEIAGVLERSNKITASLLIRMCSLGINTSLGCLQPENPHNVVSPQARMIARVTASIIASGMAAVTHAGINSVFKLGKGLSHYFFAPTHIIQSTGPTQPAINASGLRPA